MVVVDPEVTRQKFERELELWSGNAEAYRRRGWVLLGRDDLSVDVGFLGRLPIGQQPVPAMTACVRIDFTNYDLWAPSVEFIDPLTGDYAPPLVQALVESDQGPVDLIVHSHPETGRAFFCVPGIRQYHQHPQHSGDSWLLHRQTREGSLATICDRIWRAMARNLLGVQVNVQTLPNQVQLQLRLVNAPGDVAQALAAEAIRTQQAAQAAKGAPIPPHAADASMVQTPQQPSPGAAS